MHDLEGDRTMPRRLHRSTRGTSLWKRRQRLSVINSVIWILQFQLPQGLSFERRVSNGHLLETGARDRSSNVFFYPDGDGSVCPEQTDVINQFKFVMFSSARPCLYLTERDSRVGFVIKIFLVRSDAKKTYMSNLWSLKSNVQITWVA